MVTGAALYQRVLDGIYDAITGLDATAYRVDSVSAWTRGRRRIQGGGATRELEVVVDLGRATSFSRSNVLHDLRVSWMMRYRPSSEEAGGTNDQARFHAAARCVAETLAVLAPGQDSRIVPSGWDLLAGPAGDEWVIIELSAVLSLPRGT